MKLPATINSLNDDCMEVIVGACVDDFVTLANLLRVSKRWFQAVVPVLYARPFPRYSTSLSILSKPDHMSSFSRERLFFLLGLCSGFLKAAYGWDPKQDSSNGLPPKWLKELEDADVNEGAAFEEHQTVVKAPTTVNYFEYVKEIPFEDYLHFGWPHDRELAAQRVLQHVEFHGSRFTRFYSRTDSLNLLWENKVLDRLPNLTRLELETDCSVTVDDRLAFCTATEATLIEKIVHRHAEMFPGKLRELEITDQNYWIMNMRCLDEDTQKPIKMGDLNTKLLGGSDSFKTVELFLDGFVVPGLGRFLEKCRKMEEIFVAYGPSNLFSWARLEQERYENQEKEKRQMQPLQQSQLLRSNLTLSVQSQNLPLVPVKSMSIQGDCLNVYDAVSGFRHTLKEMYLTIDESFLDGRRLPKWDFVLPNLKILKSANQLVELNNLAHSCPNLEELIMYGGMHSVLVEKLLSVEQGGPGLPKKLRAIHMKGPCFFLGSFQMEALLRPLYLLESLELIADDNGDTPVSYWGDRLRVGSEDGGFKFPFLKKLWLDGYWAVKFMGCFLRVSPKLEYAKFSCNGQGSFGRDFELESVMPLEPSEQENKTDGQEDQLREMENNQSFRGWYPNLKELHFQRLDVFSRCGPPSLNLVDLASVSDTPFPNLTHLTLDKVVWHEPKEMDDFVAKVMLVRGPPLVQNLRIEFLENVDTAFDEQNYFINQYHHLTGGALARIKSRKRHVSQETKGGCLLNSQGEYYLPK